MAADPGVVDALVKYHCDPLVQVSDVSARRKIEMPLEIILDVCPFCVHLE